MQCFGSKLVKKKIMRCRRMKIMKLLISLSPSQSCVCNKPLPCLDMSGDTGSESMSPGHQLWWLPIGFSTRAHTKYGNTLLYISMTDKGYSCG